MTLYQELIADGREAAEERVHVEHRGDRATVTLADPEKLNPLSAPLVHQLRKALDELAADCGISTRRRPSGSAWCTRSSLTTSSSRPPTPGATASPSCRRTRWR